MNGAQDMGGEHGFGPIDPEAGEPVFHAEWERRAFALTDQERTIIQSVRAKTLTDLAQKVNQALKTTI